MDAIFACLLHFASASSLASSPHSPPALLKAKQKQNKTKQIQNKQTKKQNKTKPIFQPGILLSFIIEGDIKTFPDK